MPVYTYRCQEKFCGELTEAEHKPEARPTVTCWACGSKRTRKVIVSTPHMKRVLTNVDTQAAHAR